MGGTELRMHRYTWFLTAIVLLALAVDAPMLGITFIGDDALRANVDGWIAVHHSGLLEAFRRELLQEDFFMGRFHPLFVALTLVEMHLVHQPLPLKLAQLIAIGLNVVTLAFAVRELTGSPWRALLAALAAVFTLQIRSVADATNGDTLHLQMTLECGLLAIGLLAYSQRQRGWAGRASYAASILLFGAALLLYEITTPLILPLVLLSMRAHRSWAMRVASALPFCLVLAADIAAIVVVRHTWPPGAGSFYAPSFGGPFFYASLWQIASTVPFVYELVDPQSIFHASSTYWPFAVFAATAILGTAAVLAVASKRPEAGRQDRDAYGLVVALAAGAALFAPALMVASSPVYQQVIHAGLPYAPVYLQGFGFAIVVAACVPLRTFSPLATRVLISACIAGLLVIFASNVVVAGQFDAWKYARRTIVDGLVHGAASDIPVNAWVFLDNSYFWVNEASEYGPDNQKIPGALLWDSSYFYRLWSGRTWQTRPLAMEKLKAGADAFEIRSAMNGPRNGTLVVEQVRGRSVGPPALISAKIFERGTPMTPATTPAIANAFAAGDFKVVGGDSNWRISEFHPHCALLPDDALIGNAPSAVQIAYADGFSVAESDGTMRWHWAGPQAVLTLANDTAAPLVAELRAGLSTIGASRGTVTVTWPHETKQLGIGDRSQPVDIRVALPASARVEVRFKAEAPNVALVGDSRDLRFRLIDAALADVTGCTAQDSAHGTRGHLINPREGLRGDFLTARTRSSVTKLRLRSLIARATRQQIAPESPHAGL